ncbi:unnamed protein product [Urochloa humidicola]
MARPAIVQPFLVPVFCFSFAGSSSGRRRRRDEEEEDEPEPTSDNSTSDSDFIADSAEEVEDDEDNEGFAPDEDAPSVPATAAPVPSPSPLRLLMLMQMPNRARKKSGKKWRKGKKARDEDVPPLPWMVWEEANDRWLDERPATRPRTPGSPVVAAVPTADPATPKPMTTEPGKVHQDAVSLSSMRWWTDPRSCSSPRRASIRGYDINHLDLN